VLRHENAVLRRNASRVRYEPAGRAWFAALAPFIPRRQWARVFPVTPATLLARPQMPAASRSPALWPSERGSRAGGSMLNKRFAAYRDELGLEPGLDFHSLRRSYVTHLIEDGWDPLFVQQQAGHEHASTTAIYTCVSSDFRTRTLRRVLDATTAAVMAAGAP
jgi:integrase